SQRLRARSLARRVRAAWHAPRDRGKAFHGAHRRVKRSRSGEALPRDQHRADARRQGYAGSRAAHSHKRDRPLGADHQGGRRIRGLATRVPGAAPDRPLAGAAGRYVMPLSMTPAGFNRIAICVRKQPKRIVVGARVNYLSWSHFSEGNSAFLRARTLSPHPSSICREDMWYRSASFVDRILKGAKPADLPVQQGTKFEFVV